MWYGYMKPYRRKPFDRVILDSSTFYLQDASVPNLCPAEYYLTYFEQYRHTMSTYTIVLGKSVDYLTSADYDQLKIYFPAPAHFENMATDRVKWKRINMFLMTLSIKDVPEFLLKLKYVKELRKSQGPSHKVALLTRSWDAYGLIVNIIWLNFYTYCRSYPFNRLYHNKDFRRELIHAVNEHFSLAYVTTPQPINVEKSLDLASDLLIAELNEQLNNLKYYPFEINGNREPVYALLIIHTVFTVLRFSFTIPHQL